MRRRTYVKSAGAAVTGSLLAGCVGGMDDGSTEDAETNGDDTGEGNGDETSTGTLTTSVTDQPVDIDDFESCLVTIEGLWVKPRDADGGADPEMEETEAEEGEPEADTAEPTDDGDGSDPDEGEPETDSEESDEDPPGSEDDEGEEGDSEGNDGQSDGRRYIGFDEPQEADLVELQGANIQRISETELPVGEYQYLQLDVSGVRGVLVGGDEVEVDTPGNAPLQFKEPFELREREVTRFVADFAPVRRGHGDYLLRPVATGTQVLYGDAEYDPEGSGGSTDPDESDGPEESNGPEEDTGEGTDGSESGPSDEDD